MKTDPITKATKLETAATQYEAAAEAAIARAERLKTMAQEYRQRAQALRVAPIIDGTPSPELLAAERALASNSSMLMRDRAEALHVTTQALAQRSSDLSQAGDKEQAAALWKTVNDQWKVTDALRTRAKEFEQKAAERKADADRRANERRERQIQEAAYEKAQKAKYEALARLAASRNS